MKTRKSLKARIHVTSTGKLLRMKVGRSHLRRKKTKRTKRMYDDKVELHPADAGRIKKVL